MLPVRRLPSSVNQGHEFLVALPVPACVSIRSVPMKLVAEKLAKNDRHDRLRHIRADGSESISSMPRQGILPHDLVHYVVESALPLRHGFLSLVAAGADAMFVMQQAHDHANPEVETEAVHAEAIVEALQAQLWNGRFDRESFDEGVRGACAARGKPAFEFLAIDPERELFDKALELNARWKGILYYQSMTLEFCGNAA
jgi:hypothetical protein